MRIYAGVGSRETPVGIQNVMERVAEELGSSGWILRSGGAAGADRAFETGADNVWGRKEIYIPWEGFSVTCSRGCRCTFIVGQRVSMDLRAEKIAKEFHPNWHALTKGGAACHIRNVYQVLGENLKKPSDVLVCWTPRGAVTGGTATSIRVAMKFRVPVINLGGAHWTIRKLVKHIKGIGE